MYKKGSRTFYKEAKLTDWQIVAKTIQANMINKQPEIKIRDVQIWLNLSSTSLAIYYLEKLEEMKVVRRVKVNDYHKWFLNWEKK